MKVSWRLLELAGACRKRGLNAQSGNLPKSKPMRIAAAAARQMAPFGIQPLYGVILFCLGVGLAPNVTAIVAPIQADTYVKSGQPNQNFGSSNNLVVSQIERTLLKFDLAPVPFGTTGSNVKQATLLLWVDKYTTPGFNPPPFSSAFPINSLASAPSWLESTVTFNTCPGALPNTAPDVTVASSNQYLAVNVTAQVQFWLDHPGSNNGFSLGFLTAGAPGTTVQLDSKEKSGNPPMLDITLFNNGAAGPPGPPGPAATVAVGTTTTGAPGTSALVTNAGTSSAAVFNFTIPRGATGAAGPAGATGPAGAAGAAGSAGANGKTVLNGTTAPSAPDGGDGDFFLNTQAHLLFGPKAGGAWPIPGVSLVGPAGAPGAQGSTGPIGPQGLKGDTGAAGPQGLKGDTGAAGPQGLKGDTGATGAQGLKGDTGAAGPQGPQGDTGATGETGPQGPPGPNDVTGNITLVQSTATAGNILKGTEPFIHNFGVDNTFVGVDAGNFSLSGNSNAAIGAQALLSDTTGSLNTASGVQALYHNTEGENNTANGQAALFNNTTGRGNTASGQAALGGNRTGDFNTASGVGALFESTGNNNTAVGFQALFGATGYQNIAVGMTAGTNVTTGDFNIHIGNLGLASDTNVIRIGIPEIQFRTFIAGISGVTTGGTGVAVMVDSDGQLGTLSSSRRYKDDIADMGEASAALMKLRPVTFHYKTDRNPSGRTLQFGLIAEEVAEVDPGLVTRSADGRIETVLYQFLAPMLVNEFQRQQRALEAQAKEMTRQTARIAELEGSREIQTARIAALEREAAEIATLKKQVAWMAEIMQRTGQSAQLTARFEPAEATTGSGR